MNDGTQQAYEKLLSEVHVDGKASAHLLRKVRVFIQVNGISLKTHEEARKHVGLSRKALVDGTGRSLEEWFRSRAYDCNCGMSLSSMDKTCASCGEQVDIKAGALRRSGWARMLADAIRSLWRAKALPPPARREWAAASLVLLLLLASVGLYFSAPTVHLSLMDHAGAPIEGSSLATATIVGERLTLGTFDVPGAARLLPGTYTIQLTSNRGFVEFENPEPALELKSLHWREKRDFPPLEVTGYGSLEVVYTGGRQTSLSVEGDNGIMEDCRSQCRIPTGPYTVRLELQGADAQFFDVQQQRVAVKLGVTTSCSFDELPRAGRPIRLRVVVPDQEGSLSCQVTLIPESWNGKRYEFDIEDISQPSTEQDVLAGVYMVDVTFDDESGREDIRDSQAIPRGDGVFPFAVSTHYWTLVIRFPRELADVKLRRKGQSEPFASCEDEPCKHFLPQGVYEMQLAPKRDHLAYFDPGEWVEVRLDDDREMRLTDSHLKRLSGSVAVRFVLDSSGQPLDVDALPSWSISIARNNDNSPQSVSLTTPDELVLAGKYGAEKPRVPEEWDVVDWTPKDLDIKSKETCPLTIRLVPNGADWPLAGYDEGRTRSTSRLLMPFDKMERLASLSERVWCTPVAAGNSLYVAAGKTMYAVNTQTGQVNWPYPTGGNIQSSPAVLDGTVYFVSNDGNLYAVGADDGELRWSERLGSGPGRGGSPLPVGRNVYVRWGRHVYRIDQDGNKARVGEGLALTDTAETIGLTHANGIVYMADRRRVYGIPVNGQEEVEIRLDGKVDSNPVVAHGVLYVAYVDNEDRIWLAAHRVPSGEKLWHYQGGYKDAQNASTSPPAVSASTVLFVDEEDLYVLDAATGELRSKTQVGKGIAAPSGGPLPSPILWCIKERSRKAYVAPGVDEETTLLFEIDLDSEKPPRIVRIEERGESLKLRASPIIAGGRLIVTTNSGEVWVSK